MTWKAKTPPADFKVGVKGTGPEAERARDVIREALLASGYTDQPPARHLRAVPDTGVDRGRTGGAA